LQVSLKYVDLWNYALKLSFSHTLQNFQQPVFKNDELLLLVLMAKQS